MSRLTTLALSLAAWGGCASATTLAHATLDDLISKSTAIVRGKVTGSRSEMRGSMIYTFVRIRVEERWKGPAESFVEVMVPGGSAGGYRQRVTGAPDLTEGAEHVFFLWTGKSGVVRLFGLAQGVLDVSRNAQGEVIVARGLVGAPMLDDKGRAVRDEPFTMRMSDFSVRIQKTLAGGPGR